jgi:NAD(P)-dependent dehydrogenase (short-subunit alcohol dehydrogenase family)
VYDIQRHAKAFLSETFSPVIETDHWVPCDFMEGKPIISAANWMVSQSVKLDGIVHAAAHHDPNDPLLISVHEMREAFQVNLIGPLVLTMYLYQGYRFNKGARCIFLLDQRISNLPEEEIAYCTAKAATLPTVEAYKRVMPDLEILYVAMPDRKAAGSDTAEAEVARILTDSESPKNNLVVL